MRMKTWLPGLLILSAGCSSMNNTEKGLLGGGAVGAGAGALATRGHPAGILFGGILGAIFGGAVGSNQDARDDRKAAAQAHANAVHAQAARQMSLNDVIQMAQQGQSDGVIIGQINSTGSIFQLTSADVNELHLQRVSDNVINHMQSRRYVVVQPRPVMIIEHHHRPPPPPEFGVGVVIHR